jgi:DNA-binding beta-propeller fold protein YncE
MNGRTPRSACCPKRVLRSASSTARQCLATTLLLLIGFSSARLAADDDRDALPVDFDRSPVDLVAGPQDAWLAVANQTSSSVSLVDTASGRVLHEIRVEVLRVNQGLLERGPVIRTGLHPFGLALAPDGQTAYVALKAANSVGVIDLLEHRLTRMIPVERWPMYLAVSPDGRRLAVGTSGDRGVSIVDLESDQILFAEHFMGMNIGHLQFAPDGSHVYFPWMVYRQNPITPENIRLGWVLASRVARVAVEKKSRRELFSLDPPGRAVADPHGLAITADGQQLVVSAGGTHELLVMRLPAMPFQAYGGTDHLPSNLRNDTSKFDRIDLGGRPLGLRISADQQSAYVANYLKNSVQVVSLAERRLVREIPLGGAAEPTLARRGEAIFYDGARSLDQWYSCHSCHYNGGPNVVPIDTHNDGSRFTFKTVLPLSHVAETGPWTWHGWQSDLREAVQTSLTSTMLGKEASAEDVDAMLAYMQQLQPVPNPFRMPDGSLSEAAARGKRVFESARAGCAQCHSGPHFTDGKLHDVGLGSSSDRYPTFNTPTLIGVHERIRLLHDGRAQSLEEVLTGDHAPQNVAGEGELEPQQMSDLIEYLRSL